MKLEPSLGNPLLIIVRSPLPARARRALLAAAGLVVAGVASAQPPDGISEVVPKN
jgi:hypothetical protein